MNKASIQQLFLFAFASYVSTLVDNTLDKISDEKLDNIFEKMRYEDALNYCTSRCPIELQRKYTGFHMNWWNIKKETKMLKKAGFNEIYLSGYGQSFSPALRDTRYFDDRYPTISLYVEAIK